MSERTFKVFLLHVLNFYWNLHISNLWSELQSTPNRILHNLIEVFHRFLIITKSIWLRCLPLGDVYNPGIQSTRMLVKYNIGYCEIIINAELDEPLSFRSSRPYFPMLDLICSSSRVAPILTLKSLIMITISLLERSKYSLQLLIEWFNLFVISGISRCIYLNYIHYRWSCINF